MSGQAFWITVGLVLPLLVLMYRAGYAAGWTDGAAEARKWGTK